MKILKNSENINNLDNPEKESREWKKEGFKVMEELKKVKGIFLEIGGPTKKGYQLVDLDKLEKKVYIFNLFPGAPKFRRKKGEVEENKELLNYYGKVDYIADAMDLPHKNDSVGAIFVSCLGGGHFKDLATYLSQQHKKEYKESFSKVAKNKESEGIEFNQDELAIFKDKLTTPNLRHKVIQEAWKALEPGGLLIWEGGREEDFKIAEDSGFELVQQKARKKKDNSYNLYSYLIFQKPKQE